MKKIISIILAFVMMFLAAAAVFANSPENDVEIIFSENFEGDLSRWHINYSGVGMARDEKDSYIGKCVLISAPFSGIFEPLTNINSIESIFFDVVGGETYTVAADMMGKGFQKGYILFFNEKGRDITGGKYIFSNNSGDEKWHCGFSTIIAPLDAKSAKILLEGPSSGNPNGYDNVIVCKGMVGFSSNFSSRKEFSPKATDNSNTDKEALNPVFYENFESKIEDWNHSDRKSETKVKRDDELAFTGGFSLMVKDDITDKAVGITSPYFEIEGGAEYKLSADIYKDMSLDKTATVDIVYYSLSNSRLGKATVSGDSLNWNNYSVTALAPKDAAKANIFVESGSGTTTSYIDNIMVVKTKDKPIEETKLDKINKSSIVLFVGSSNALVNGNKTLIDTTNDKVIATIVDGRTLVPVRFIAENFGAEVGWDDASRTVTLTLKDKTVKIVLDKAEIDINGEITTIDVPAQSIEGRTMLPLRAFVENVMGKKIFWDARGLIVITDSDMLDATADKDTIDALADRIKK